MNKRTEEETIINIFRTIGYLLLLAAVIWGLIGIYYFYQVYYISVFMGLAILFILILTSMLVLVISYMAENSMLMVRYQKKIMAQLIKNNKNLE